MKIAVLIPCHNAGQYLRECLESVLNQVVPVEIYACDDGSSDDTYEQLRQYAAGHREMHVFHRENSGVSATRNFLLDQLGGEFDAVCFVDSDDTVSPSMLSVLASAMNRTGADVAECAITGNPDSMYVGDGMDIRDTVTEDLRSGRWINVVNKLYRRRVVEKVRFRPGLYFEEDNFFNREVNRIAHRKVIVDAAMYHYRDNPKSATGKLDINRYYASVSERVRLTLEVFGTSAELSKDAYRMMIRKNLKKNRDAADRRRLFLAAGEALAGFERRYGFRPTGLNPVQLLIWKACRSGRYLTARVLALFT